METQLLYQKITTDMTLTFEEIKSIILSNPNKALLTKLKDYSKKLRMHIYGENLKGYITRIDQFERDELKELRLKYAKPNKDLFSRLSRPLDKVFSARGGSTYFNLSAAQDKVAMSYALDVRDGLSIKKWVELFWRPHFLDDPNGFIFMEVGDENKYPLMTTYPTYKPVSCVYDYQTKGTEIEYVVFELSPTEKANYILKTNLDKKELDKKWFRVVDDGFDYILIQESDDITIIDDLTLPNLFEEVPAILNSDIVNSNGEGYISLFDEVIDLADQFLLKGSIKVTHDFMHCFPKYWEYADDCGTCHGNKYVEGKDCPDCKGTGKRIMTRVTDVKLLNYPQDKNSDAIVTPNVAGYVSPDKTYHEISMNDLADLEDAMTYTIWGTEAKKKPQGPTMPNGGKGQPKTATQVIDDIAPKIDRLFPISEAAEKRHKFILDHVIDLQVSPGYDDGEGSSVNYGRRYMIETIDALELKYTDARKNGLPTPLLDDILIDLTETRYHGDPVNLAINLKLIKVEPFVHMTIAEAEPLVQCVLDYMMKLYFSDWVKSLEKNELLMNDVPTLKGLLEAFAQAAMDRQQAEPTMLTQEARAAADMAAQKVGDRVGKEA